MIYASMCAIDSIKIRVRRFGVFGTFLWLLSIGLAIGALIDSMRM